MKFKLILFAFIVVGVILYLSLCHSRAARVDPWHVPYDNSLFIDPKQPGYLGR